MVVCPSAFWPTVFNTLIFWCKNGDGYKTLSLPCFLTKYHVCVVWCINTHYFATIFEMSWLSRDQGFVGAILNVFFLLSNWEESHWRLFQSKFLDYKYSVFFLLAYPEKLWICLLWNSTLGELTWTPVATIDWMSWITYETILVNKKYSSFSEKKYSLLLSCSHQLVAWRLGVDVLLVDVEEEEAEGGASHDDHTTH